MFKFLILSAVLAVAAAKPGYLQLAAPAPALAPVATSYSSRVDYRSPVVATSYVQAAPVVQTVQAVPVVQPVISQAVSSQSQSRVDVSSPQVVSAAVPYSVGVVGHPGGVIGHPGGVIGHPGGVIGHPGSLLTAHY